MKAVMITYNQVNTERVEYMLDKLEIRGYTQWIGTLGRGSVDGDPHMGTHTWPEMNNTTLAVVEDEKVDLLLQKIENLNNINHKIGVRAFVWSVERTV